MQLKVPPVAVFLIAMLLLYAGATVLPQFNLSFPGQAFIAMLFVVAAILPGGQAVLAFVKNKTTVNPTTPDRATTLVTDGFYRLSRNPMYLGLLCLLLALAVFYGTLTALIIVPAFIWYMTEFQIKPEEDALRRIFGADYSSYQKRVRRWI
ncbi:MAG: isoprenylcysteine carboxylmethyltransferase family protein [Roseibium sp.]|uniref:methyltransferase family protein n=1 Tax=Roseibium sp. TaxID=1936156 RepID=UPI00260DB8D5|nr:isoprenylcysteine carboxylmethyltransferase family protein [Roseibium sp.]MCV0428782.1 isoprenylcysteine carboxylmethyltransferase family protein [Roseibium sp.]